MLEEELLGEGLLGLMEVVLQILMVKHGDISASASLLIAKSIYEAKQTKVRLRYNSLLRQHQVNNQVEVVEFHDAKPGQTSDDWTQPTPEFHKYLL